MTFKKGHIPWSKGKTLSEETRKKMSESRSGEKHPMYGKHHSDDTCKKISECIRGEKHPFYGKHHSEESRKRMSVIHSRKHLSDETLKKMCESHRGERNVNFGRHLSNEHKQKISIANIGKTVSEETRKKLSERLGGENNPNFGKHISEETCKKLRISAINYLENTSGISPRIGSNEKSLLDIQEQKDNIKILRNYKISELGYFVDGYCKETNTVYEVYEKYHDRQVQKDLQRENEICNHLGCDFIIIWDENK